MPKIALRFVKLSDWLWRAAPNKAQHSRQNGEAHRIELLFSTIQNEWFYWYGNWDINIEVLVLACISGRTPYTHSLSLYYFQIGVEFSGFLSWFMYFRRLITTSIFSTLKIISISDFHMFCVKYFAFVHSAVLRARHRKYELVEWHDKRIRAWRWKFFIPLSQTHIHIFADPAFTRPRIVMENVRK